MKALSLLLVLITTTLISTPSPQKSLTKWVHPAISASGAALAISAGITAAVYYQRYRKEERQQRHQTPNQQAKKTLRNLKRALYISVATSVCSTLLGIASFTLYIRQLRRCREPAKESPTSTTPIPSAFRTPPPKVPLLQFPPEPPRAPKCPSLEDLSTEEGKLAHLEYLDKMVAWFELIAQTETPENQKYLQARAQELRKNAQAIRIAMQAVNNTPQSEDFGLSPRSEATTSPDTNPRIPSPKGSPEKTVKRRIQRSSSLDDLASNLTHP